VYQKVGINYEWTIEDNAVLQKKLPEILYCIKENLNDLAIELKT
jgi:hypothetical protein